MASDDVVEVRMLNLPVPAYALAQEHLEDLLREFELITQSAGPDLDGSVPARLVALVDELETTYRATTLAQDMRLVQAVEAGEREIDELVFWLPHQAAWDSSRLGHLLDDADDYCVAENLLTPGSPAEAKRFRDWYLGEIIRQILGHPPTSWIDASGQRSPDRPQPHTPTRA